MTNPHSHRTAPAKPQPPLDAADIDTLLIDDDADDFLDRYLADFRESLADYRNL